MTECPVCGAARVRCIGQAVGLALVRCDACGHDFALQLAEGATVLAEHYDAHYSGFRNDPVFVEKIRQKLRESIVPLVAPPASILDVGCGNGEFLVAAQEQGYRGLGMDFSEAAVRMCQARGVEAVMGDFLTYDFRERAPFDMVTFWDVCEHLSDPVAFARRAHALLRPGGYMVAKVPMVTRRTVELVRRVPRLAGLLLGAPGHVQYFRRETLTLVLRRAGFETVHWLATRGLRSPGEGGSLRKRAARRVRTALHRWAGDGNLLVAAKREP